LGRLQEETTAPEAREADARLGALLEEFGRLLRGLIERRCPKDLGIQVADIEQEARIRLWRALKDGKELGSAASYIYRVARSVTIDALRRAKARREEQLGTIDRERDSASALVVGPDQQPDRIAEANLLAERIAGALQALAPSRRQAVELRLQGFGHAEIADLLGWSEPRARGLLYRGLEDLRRELRVAGIEYEGD
jgi:RNA polymerase sigma-70 factor (ECF subfamily)